MLMILIIIYNNYFNLPIYMIMIIIMNS